jgi:hypothetical protein
MQHRSPLRLFAIVILSVYSLMIIWRGFFGTKSLLF